MGKENALASHDAGDGTVEVRTRRDPAVVGDDLDVDVVFAGRDAEWNVNAVSLALEAPYRTTDGFRKATVERFTLVDDPEIDSPLEETRTATVTVPPETPGTVGSANVVATVEFDTDRGTDATEAHLDVTDPRLEAAFTATVDVGFAPQDIDRVADSSDDGPPFAHRFRFRPTDGASASGRENVELFCQSVGDEVGLVARTPDGGESPADLAEVDGPRTTLRGDEESVGPRVEQFLQRALRN